MAYEAIWASDTSKLNKLEIAKLEKDGLEVIRTIIEHTLRRATIPLQQTI